MEKGKVWGNVKTDYEVRLKLKSGNVLITDKVSNRDTALTILKLYKERLPHANFFVVRVETEIKYEIVAL